MAIRTELSLRLPNSPGALGDVCRLLAEERVNIAALSLDTAGQLRLVVDNHLHGAAVLREHHHRVVERDVIVLSVSHRPGGVAPALRLVSQAGVNVEYVYGGGFDGAPMGIVVLGVDEAVRAAASAGV